MRRSDSRAGNVLGVRALNRSDRWLHQRNRATLIVEHFDALRKQDRAALAEEGARLVTFATADSKTHDVRLVHVS